jgi:hypothetical protein
MLITGKVMVMKNSIHATKRMAQRGIDRAMIELVLNHGVIDGDKYILNKKNACACLEEIRQQMRVLMRVIDKGGLVVIPEGNTLITTYNCNG